MKREDLTKTEKELLKTVAAIEELINFNMEKSDLHTRKAKYYSDRANMINKNKESLMEGKE